MTDFNHYLTIDKEVIAASLEKLTGDEKLNYLYFLRDEINKQIKKSR